MKSSGFTLVEIQIALVILVLIVSVLMGGIQLSNKSMKAVNKLSEKSADNRIISQLLTRQISSLLPLTSLENGKNKLLFAGNQTSLYYMGILSEHVVNGGPWLIHLHYQNGQLLFDYRVFDNTISMAENKTLPFESQVLLDGVDDFSIEYKAITNQWKSSWNDKETPPVTVTIHIKQVGDVWPAITIPIYSYAATKTPFHLLIIK